jgi:integrase/recombinase XerD
MRFTDGLCWQQIYGRKGGLVTAPVEYAVAVDAYLGQAPLAAASRRVYRISLAGWAWPLAGRPIPAGPWRTGAAPPVVPLALLDDPGTAGRLAEAFADRAARSGTRTANRELSALRGAVSWWQDLGWIRTDPTAGLRHRAPDQLAAPLSAGQVGALFRLPASLREQTFWRLLYDSGAPAAAMLALGAGQLDLALHRARRPPCGAAGQAADIAWGEPAGQFLRWLLAGRTWGPVFITSRRTGARTASAAAGDVCQLTGQVRLSYRRAAEIFAAATRPLDPAGRGWTLHQLSAAQASLPSAQL